MREEGSLWDLSELTAHGVAWRRRTRHSLLLSGIARAAGIAQTSKADGTTDQTKRREQTSIARRRGDSRLYVFSIIGKNKNLARAGTLPAASPRALHEKAWRRRRGTDDGGMLKQLASIHPILCSAQTKNNVIISSLAVLSLSSCSSHAAITPPLQLLHTIFVFTRAAPVWRFVGARHASPSRHIGCCRLPL